MSQIVVIGGASSRRVELFQEALCRLHLPQARVVSYIDLISGAITLPDVIAKDSIVRIESPGKDFEVGRALLEQGLEAAASDGCASISKDELDRLVFDRGRILAPRQWYLGYVGALRKIKEQLSNSNSHQVMNHPDDIELMFDKARCHQLFSMRDVPVPRALGMIGSYEELKTRMRENRFSQVFVKLNHGSSASGVVAYRTNGSAHKAITTVEMVREGGKLLLYNSRKILTYENESEIRQLIDELCRHKVHVEEWFPKAKLSKKAFDLRVVMIGGKARHIVVRESDSPFTNLHLLNTRSDPAALQEKLGATRWQQLLYCCERAMVPFDRSLYAGIDLMIGPNLRSHAIAEINAFGDHVNDSLWQGRDTYTAELETLSATQSQPSAARETTQACHHKQAANCSK